MRYTLASLALAALAAASPLRNEARAPAGCSESYSGQFEIQVVNVTSSTKRAVAKRQDNDDTTLVLTLTNGVLKDSQNRQGYIASNHQFQFNTPLQTNALATSGFSVCSNGSLALTSAVWYQCLSGTFYNLYDSSIGGQCTPVYIDIIPTSGTSTGSATAASQPVATEQSDGQPTASAVTSPVCEYKDGQPQQGCTTSAVCEYVDGQPQAGCSATATPTSAVCEYKDGQPQAGCSTTSAVCEYVDGQPQAGCSTTPTPTPTSAVCEYKDGQPQEGCSTASAVCEYVDGQPQAGCSATATPTSAVCEYVDGQPQAGCSTTPTPTPTSAVCEYKDGQPQEGCSTASAVCEYVDGQPQAGCSATATPTSAVCEYKDGQPQAGCSTAVAAQSTLAVATGAAVAPAARADLFGLAAGILAIAVL